jgi:glutamate racemase
MGNRKPVGVFDSGVGGLTVVRELLREVPGERIIYIGDTARYPYGSRSKEAVCRMAEECIKVLVEQDIKMMVMACNTATAFAFDYLSKLYQDIPFVGVVDPCVEAVGAAVKEGQVGIIGTEGTVSGGIYEKRLKQMCPDIEPVPKACPLLVPLAEEGILGGPILDHVLDLYLKHLKKKNLKAVILGCTHYPFFKKQISAYFKGEVQILDSATWTAKKVSETLDELYIKSGASPIKMKHHRFLVTDYPEKFKKTGEQFLGQEIPLVEKIVV